MKNFFRCFIDDYHEGMKQMYHGKNKVRRHTFRGDDDFLMVMMQSLRGEGERAIGSLHCGHTGGCLRRACTRVVCVQEGFAKLRGQESAGGRRRLKGSARGGLNAVDSVHWPPRRSEGLLHR